MISISASGEFRNRNTSARRLYRQGRRQQRGWRPRGARLAGRPASSALPSTQL